MSASRAQKAALAAETLRILEAGFYTARGVTVNIKAQMDASVQGSILYSPNDFNPDMLTVRAENVRPETSPTRFTVEAETSLSAARRFAIAEAQTSGRVMVLNFASAKNPGGGFLGGSQAQEESLARSSALYPCINQMQKMYRENRKSESCLYFHYMIYSPDVPVIRTDNGDLLERTYNVSFITAPAPNAGVARKRLPNPAETIQTTMLERMDRILGLCMLHKCDTLVLGAYGCGVFGNNIDDVAYYFRVLLTKKYKNVFQHVHFAVPDRADVFHKMFRV